MAGLGTSKVNLEGTGTPCLGTDPEMGIFEFWLNSKNDQLGLNSSKKRIARDTSCNPKSAFDEAQKNVISTQGDVGA